MEDSNAYYIPEKNASACLRSLNSRFIAKVYYVQSSEEAREILKNLRAEYYDAAHICFAWILGDRGETKMASDAGEPAHSAGTPILNAIRTSGLTFTLVAVVRYFGGAKLGIPGLIQAFGTVAKMALEDAGSLKKIPECCFELIFSYEITSFVERLIHVFNGRIKTKDYGQNCRFELIFAAKDQAAIVQYMEESNIACTFNLIE